MSVIHTTPTLPAALLEVVVVGFVLLVRLGGDVWLSDVVWLPTPPPLTVVDNTVLPPAVEDFDRVALAALERLAGKYVLVLVPPMMVVIGGGPRVSTPQDGLVIVVDHEVEPGPV